MQKLCRRLLEQPTGFNKKAVVPRICNNPLGKDVFAGLSTGFLCWMMFINIRVN